MCLFVTVTKSSSRLKKSDRRKKLPSKPKLNGIAEKPALPTGTVPGGGRELPWSRSSALGRAPRAAAADVDRVEVDLRRCRRRR